MKVKNDHRSKFSSLKQLERRSLKKNQFFNGIRTGDLRDTASSFQLLKLENLLRWSFFDLFQDSGDVQRPESSRTTQNTLSPDPGIPLNQVQPRGSESEDKDEQDSDYITYVVREKMTSLWEKKIDFRVSSTRFISFPGQKKLKKSKCHLVTFLETSVEHYNHTCQCERTTARFL